MKCSRVALPLLLATVATAVIALGPKQAMAAKYGPERSCMDAANEAEESADATDWRSGYSTTEDQQPQTGNNSEDQYNYDYDRYQDEYASSDDAEETETDVDADEDDSYKYDAYESEYSYDYEDAYAEQDAEADDDSESDADEEDYSYDYDEYEYGYGYDNEDVDADQMDCLIAVTDNDAVNMLAAMIADRFGIPRKIARVRSLEFDSSNAILSAEDLKIDLVIHPEELTAREILHSCSSLKRRQIRAADLQCQFGTRHSGKIGDAAAQFRAGTGQ